MPLDAARDGLTELRGQLIGMLAVRNAALAERVAQLDAANAELAERLARLERAVSRNSGFSSMPPSSDDQPGRKTPQPRQRQGGTKRRPGKQPGTAGAYLPWNDHPDGTIAHFPEGTCGCGRNLAGGP